MPAHQPFYPPLPARYSDVKLQYVLFYATPVSVQAFLPEPLQATDDGLCVAAGIDVGACPNYGPFQETFLQLRCRFRDQVGFYCSHVFHNGPTAIAAGREIYGTPKVYAEVRVSDDPARMVSRASLAGALVMEVSGDKQDPIGLSSLPEFSPSWRLKLIPRADGPAPAIKQLIDAAAATTDLAVQVARRGSGTVAFTNAGGYDLSPLAPTSYGGAYYIECSYSEGFARIAFDYLSG